MMSGRFYIDGKDAFTEYGIYVQEGGYNELVAFPPLKAVTSNDWQEEDGIEPDLSEPTLNTKEFSLKIVLSGMDYRWGGFIERLSDKAYHTFDFREIGRTYRLRLVSNPNTDLATLLGFITIKLADDFPLDGYTYKEPESTVPGSDYYELDGKPFSVYGVHVLDGTLNEIEKSPNVKTSLLRNINKLNGALYDGEKVTYKAKDVKINCLMKAASLTELWRNYNALLMTLCVLNNGCYTLMKRDVNTPAITKAVPCPSFTPLIKYGSNLPLPYASFHSGLKTMNLCLPRKHGIWL